VADAGRSQTNAIIQCQPPTTRTPEPATACGTLGMAQLGTKKLWEKQLQAEWPASAGPRHAVANAAQRGQSRAGAVAPEWSWGGGHKRGRGQGGPSERRSEGSRRAGAASCHAGAAAGSSGGGMAWCAAGSSSGCMDAGRSAHPRVAYRTKASEGLGGRQEAPRQGLHFALATLCLQARQNDVTERSTGAALLQGKGPVR
jgi:hypothetical protein